MKLSNKNIDEAIQKFQDFFESVKASKKDRIKLCFLLEEALLRYQEKFGEDHEFKFIIKKWFGTPKVLIRVKGAPYNPIEDNSEENIFSASIIQNLLNYEQAGTIYRYENGCNEISAFPTKEVKKFKIIGGSIIIPIVLAIVLATLLKSFATPYIQSLILEDILNPILSKMLGAIVAVNVPMIFISTVASICAIENITMLHDVGTKILVRFFALMFFLVTLSIFVCALFFPVVNLDFEDKSLQGDLIELDQIFELILGMVPQNFIAPFLEGNILQSVIIALLVGICVTILGDRVSEFKNLVISLKQIIFKMMDIVMKLIPLVIFLCIFKTILNGSFDEILAVWKIVASEYVLCAAITLIMLARIKMKYGVKIIDFLKKISPAFLISFTTGSGSASMPVNMKVCVEELKIDKNLCEFYIPLSHAICQTSKIIGIVACTFYAAEFSGAQISISQLVIIAFLSVQFAIAAASGNGGLVAAMSLLLVQLGFSLDAIGPMSIADIFIVNLSGVITLIVRDCDLLDLSHELKEK